MPRRQTKSAATPRANETAPTAEHRLVFPSRWACVALLTAMIATAVAYHTLPWHDYLRYDDQDYVTANRDLEKGLSWSGVRWAFVGFHAYNYHPVTWLSHLADFQFFGRRAGAHHLVSLLLHLIAGTVLWGVIGMGTARWWPATFVAAAFLLHPTAVESVAWVAERKNIVSTLFWFLALAAWLAYGRRPGWPRYAATAALFLLGLLSKQMLVTFPFVLLLIDFWPLGRLRLPEPGQPWGPTLRRAGWLLVEKLPLIALSVLFSVLVLLAQGHRSIRLPVSQRLSNAAVGYFDYLATLFWPTKLSIFHPYDLDRLTAARIAAGAIILVLGSGLALWQLRRRPYLAVGWFWFVGTLVPVIGLVQTGLHARADRMLYVAGVGPFVALAFFLDDCRQRWPRASWALLGVAGLWLSGCFWQTAVYAPKYRDTYTLFSYVLSVDPRNGIAHHLVGQVERERGRLPQAFEHLKAAALLMPGQPRPNLSFAQLLFNLNRAEEAIRFFTRTIEVNDSFTQAYFERGYAYLFLGQAENALRDFDVVLRRSPGEPTVVLHQGMALLMLSRDEEAAQRFEQVLRSRPDDVQAHYYMGQLLLRWPPGGRPKLAEAHFRKVLASQPGHADATDRLALLLATSADPEIRRPNEALLLAEGLCARENYQHAGHLDTLAVACASASQFDRAMQIARQALQIAERDDQAAVVTRIKARLARYELGQPVVEMP